MCETLFLSCLCSSAIWSHVISAWLQHVLIFCMWHFHLDTYLCQVPDYCSGLDCPNILNPLLKSWKRNLLINQEKCHFWKEPQIYLKPSNIISDRKWKYHLISESHSFPIIISAIILLSNNCRVPEDLLILYAILLVSIIKDRATDVD